jgi:tetratricopeptide (TPR) repeat protein
MKGMVDESIEAGLKAIEIEPDFPVAHNNMIIAYLQKGEYEKAALHCDKAVELGYEVAPEVLNEINTHR